MMEYWKVIELGLQMVPSSIPTILPSVTLTTTSSKKIYNASLTQYPSNIPSNFPSYTPPNKTSALPTRNIYWILGQASIVYFFLKK